MHNEGVQGDRIKDDMGGTCSTHGRDENTHKILVWKRGGWSPFEAPRRNCKDNIKSELKGTECENPERVCIAQESVQYRSVLNIVMNLRVTWKAGNF